MTEIPKHLRDRAERARAGVFPPLPGLATDVARIVAEDFASRMPAADDDEDEEDRRMVVLSMAMAFAAGREKTAAEVVADAREFHAYLFPEPQEVPA